MEFIDRDELVEITPDAIRMRKKILAGQPAPQAQRRTRHAVSGRVRQQTQRRAAVRQCDAADDHSLVAA